MLLLGQYYIESFIFFMAGLVAGLVVTPLVVSLLKEAGLVRPNFRLEEIPTGAGMSFLLALLLAFLPLSLFFKVPRLETLSFFLGMWGISFLGLVDDVLGTHFSRGFSGHFKNLLRGRLTTGGLKAVGGGFLALFISLSWNDTSGFADIGKWFLDALLIALFTNALNLFDLRPGRAAKVFLLAASALVAVGFGSFGGNLLLCLAGAVLAFLPRDLNALAMMGDTGSNILGMALGIVSAQVLPFPVKTGLFIFLIAFHVFTEKYSLTAIIEKNRLLKTLDMLGREKQE